MGSRDFLSDTSAGAHPQVVAAVAAAAEGRVPGYGADPYTEEATAALEAHFGEDASVFLVWGGTGANVLCMRALVRSYHAVLCTEHAHLHADEAAATEHAVGCKLLTVPSPDGKLRPEDVERCLWLLGDQQHAQPRAVSLTQSTELGTVYRVDELRAVADIAHAAGLLVHVDGARLANAAASLGCSLRALTADAGVDALSFGGTKNGLLGTEAVVLFPSVDAADMPWLRKQTTQLAAKMRFLGAQFAALMRDDLWLSSAHHANAMARRLADGLAPLPGVEIVFPVEANAVFARLEPALERHLRDEGFGFHRWGTVPGVVRLMTSFATTPDEVDDLVAAACRVSV